MFEIEDHIIEQADKCSNSKICLCEGSSPKCELKEKTAYEICSSEKFNIDCPYNIKFMQKLYCTCPVRKDIYNRYDK